MSFTHISAFYFLKILLIYGLVFLFSSVQAETSQIFITPSETSDLHISVMAPQTVIQGKKIRYNIAIKNAGPDKAKAIHANMQLPENTLLVLSSSGCEDSIGQLNCKLGSLESGATRHLAVILKASQTVTTLKFSTRVSSNSADPKPENNHANNKVTVQADMPVQPYYMHYTPVVMNHYF